MNPEDANPWDLQLYPLNKAAESFPSLCPFYELWLSKRSGREMPAWQDFDFRDFRGWHGWISVEDISHEPFDLRMRLWGSQLALAYGYELTGRLMSQTIELRGLQQRDIDFLKAVCQDRQVGIASGTVDWREREYVRVYRLFLPCGREGERPDILLTAAARDAVARTT
jgi:hypothetical protein